MPDDGRPNPLSDVRKGLGLLFRAARTAVGRLPRTDLEEAVVTSAKEVGRAIENVASTIEREVLGKAKPRGKGDARPDGDDASSEGGSKPSDQGPPDVK